VAKVTVYVTDSQLEKLRRLRGFGRGGVSKAFQAFLEDAAGEGLGGGRYDYARRVMPVVAALDRHRERLASRVAEGGPPADGGPVAAALTLLLHRELLRRRPDLEEAIERELTRFGLDELIATETADLDLTVEPPADPVEEAAEIEDEPRRSGPASSGFDFRFKGLGEEIVAEALRHAGIWGAASGSGGENRTSGTSSRIEIRVGSDDDPRECLSVRDYDEFRERHPEWSPDAEGQRLSQEQVGTIVELLRRRAEAERDR
jgi:hypothetical protein